MNIKDIEECNKDLDMLIETNLWQEGGLSDFDVSVLKNFISFQCNSSYESGYQAATSVAEGSVKEARRQTLEEIKSWFEGDDVDLDSYGWIINRLSTLTKDH